MRQPQRTFTDDYIEKQPKAPGSLLELFLAPRHFCFVFSSLRSLAAAYPKAGKDRRVDEVVQEHQSAATLVSDVTDDARKGKYLIAELHSLRGNFAAAIKFDDQELSEAQGNNDLESELLIFRKLAACFLEKGDRPKFVDAFRALVSVADKLSHPLVKDLQHQWSEIENE